jgi:hypothetical protein
VRPFLSDDANLRAEMLGGEESEDENRQGGPIIKSRHDYNRSPKNMSTELDPVIRNSQN